jgi:hypothetical protein
MDPMIRRCLAMTAAAAALVVVLLAAGVPGATILAFAPVVVCLGAHALMGHGTGHGTADRHDDAGAQLGHGQR